MTDVVRDKPIHNNIYRFFFQFNLINITSNIFYVYKLVGTF